MPREDYEKFICMKNEFKHPLDHWSDVGGEDKYNCIDKLIRESSGSIKNLNRIKSKGDK